MIPRSRAIASRGLLEVIKSDPYFNCSNYGGEYSTLRLGKTVNPYYVPWKLVPTGTTLLIGICLKVGSGWCVFGVA